MRKLPLAAQVYIWLVLGVAALALGLTFPLHRLGQPGVAGLLVFFLALRLLALRNPLYLSHTVRVHVSTAIDVWLILGFGPGPAVLVVGLSRLVDGLVAVRQGCRGWFFFAFSGARDVVAVALAGGAYVLLRGGQYALGQDLLAAGMAGLLLAALGVGMLLGIVHVARQESVRDAARKIWVVMPQEMALVVLGVVGGEVYEVSPGASLLLLVPLAGMYYALRTSLGLRNETKLAIERLASQVDAREPYTEQHSVRVADYAERIASAMRLLPSEVDLIARTARIHDLGKLSLSTDIINKPGRLESWEQDEIRKHPVVGAEIVGAFEGYQNGKDFILYHHERYDGSGYPFGLKGDQIPRGARIMAVADAFDAMTSDRPYRKAMSFDRAMLELTHYSGSQFDPQVVEVFRRVFSEEDLALQPRPAVETAGVHPVAQRQSSVAT